MWGAAPQDRRAAAHVLAALTVFSVVSGYLAAPAQAAPDTSTAPVAQPSSFWGVEIDRVSYPLLNSKLVDPAAQGRCQHARRPRRHLVARADGSG